MPSSCDEIATARTLGRVRCGTTAAETVEAVATAFGLMSNATTYREIDFPTARDIVVDLLHRDLAYRMVLMPADQAGALADAFLTDTSRHDARYFTNVCDGWKSSTVVSWNPATTATFDRGVLLVSSSGSACLWVEDED